LKEKVDKRTPKWIHV